MSRIDALRGPNKLLRIFAATALAGTVDSAHCAQAPASWFWTDAGIDRLLMLLAALFWVVTHLWALIVLWAECRAALAKRRPTASLEAEVREARHDRDTAT